MPVPSTLTPLPVAIPLVGAALLAALRKWLSRAAADWLGILFAATTQALTILLLAHSMQGVSVYWFGNWFPRGPVVLGISFLVEPVAALIALLAALLTLLALIFSWRFVDDGGHHLQPLMLIFLAAMCGFAFTADLFNLFVFFELMSTAAFALCGLKTAEPAPLQGAFNFAITNTIAAFLVLIGISLLYAVTGALNMAQIGLALQQRHDPLVLFAFTVLVCGFLIKAAVFPFHLWLPDAHAVAPTPVCVLFSGLMVELGLYAIVRIRSVVFGQTFLAHEPGLRLVLIVFGVATIVVGSLMCYSEHHLKRVLAFSTISHAGVMLLAIAMDTPLALAAWFIYVVAHAFIKGALFFVAGILLHRLRAIGERDLFGEGRPLRWTAILWFLGAAGLAGVPPFGTMLAEVGLAHAEQQTGLHVLSWFCLFASIVTSAALLRIGMHVFFGWGSTPITDEAAKVGELPEDKEDNAKIFAYHFVPPAFCLTTSVACTLVPAFSSTARDAISRFASQPAILHAVYTGQSFLIQQASWQGAIPGAAIRGSIALLCACVLACTSVFRASLPRPLRMGAHLESGVPALRAMQSGHTGDYVAWISVGLAVFALMAILMLRA